MAQLTRIRGEICDHSTNLACVTDNRLRTPRDVDIELQTTSCGFVAVHHCGLIHDVVQVKWLVEGCLMTAFQPSEVLKIRLRETRRCGTGLLTRRSLMVKSKL